jgi:hypothetical protein
VLRCDVRVNLPPERFTTADAALTAPAPAGAAPIRAAALSSETTWKAITMREREGLIARIRQIRRVAAASQEAATSTAGVPEADRVPALEARVAHLERLVEGLQDSVHRESERHGKMIADLQAQLEPGALGAALAEDARNRGL